MGCCCEKETEYVVEQPREFCLWFVELNSGTQLGYVYSSFVPRKGDTVNFPTNLDKKCKNSISREVFSVTIDYDDYGTKPSTNMTVHVLGL